MKYDKSKPDSMATDISAVIKDWAPLELGPVIDSATADTGSSGDNAPTAPESGFGDQGEYEDGCACQAGGDLSGSALVLALLFMVFAPLRKRLGS